MKLYGSLSRLVSILFRKDSQDLTFQPNQSTTYTGSRAFQLPPGDASHVLVSADSTQTFTNKTFDADGTGNSLSNIDNANIKSGAAIDATKIHDGSVDNTEFGYLNGVTSSIQQQFNSDKWKQPARAASTANVDISTDLENGDTLDGVTLATGDRVLLKNQSTGTQNGIYVVAATGAASRAVDADASAEFPAMYVQVQEGTANADTLWNCTNNNDFVLGSDTPTYVRFYSGSADQVTGPASSTDNAVARFDGTTGKVIQNSGVIVDDLNRMSGITQLDVDSVRIDGNSIQTTDVNGNLTFDLNGTGEVNFETHANLRAANSLRFNDSDNSNYIGHKAPSSVTTNVTYTWPEAPAANNYVLKSQTDGTLSWSASAINSFAADWDNADGATKTIVHNLGTKDIQVEIYDTDDDTTILVDSVVRTDANTLDLTASEAPAVTWRVTIHGL